MEQYITLVSQSKILPALYQMFVKSIIFTLRSLLNEGDHE